MPDRVEDANRLMLFEQLLKQRCHASLSIFWNRQEFGQQLLQLARSSSRDFEKSHPDSVNSIRRNSGSQLLEMDLSIKV